MVSRPSNFGFQGWVMDEQSQGNKGGLKGKGRTEKAEGMPSCLCTAWA